MKKLLVAGAIICSAVVSQAAFVTWAISAVKENDVSLTKGYEYVFFYATQTAADSAAESFAALAGKGASAFSSAVASANFSDTKKATAAGNFGVNTSAALGGYTTTQLGNAALGLKGATTYYALALILDTETVTDKSNYIITDVKSFTTKDDGAATSSPINFSSQAGKTWNAVGAVPEPTSAMLLLLGVAGLALKRKRA